MLTEWELWACANKYIQDHDADAPILAVMRADELRAAGDEVGARTFQADREADQSAARSADRAAPLAVPFPDPDERPNDDRNLKVEFAVLLVMLLGMLIVGARSAWDTLSGLF